FGQWLHKIADSAQLDGRGVRLVVLPYNDAPTNDPIRIFDVSTGELAATLTRADGAPGVTLAVQLSPDGKWLGQPFFTLSTEAGAVAPTEMSYRVWNVSAGRQLWQTPPRRTVNFAAFSADSRLLALGYVPSGVEVWDVSRGEPLFRWDPPGVGAV